MSRLKINVDVDYDYFRSIAFQYLADSVETEKGWKYAYKTSDKAVLKSLGDNEFTLTNIIAKKFRILIYNNDNRPLDINSVTISGFKYELIARFTTPADYKLVYGNENARAANYDLTHFRNNIPENLKSLSLGNEVLIKREASINDSAWFENEFWLWGIMGILILILGGFTFKMLQHTGNE